MEKKYYMEKINRINVFKNPLKMKGHFLEDKEHILQRANELLNQTFVFDRIWDMERCITPYTLEHMNWNIICNDDEEWCFMLNRMDYLPSLIQAYVLTKNVVYLEKWKFYTLDWIEQHKELVESLSTRTLDTAIRCLNMMEGVAYLVAFEAIKDDEIEMIINSVKAQFQYLRKEYKNKYTLSNWGSIQTSVMLICIPMFNKDYANNDLFLWAKEEFETQFELQVYEDGSHWEQSTMYHIEVLNYGLRVAYYDKFFSYGLSKDFYQTLYAMSEFVLHQKTPKHCIENFGDSDRSDVRDVLSRAAYIFTSEKLKQGAYKSFDHDSIYLFGIQANNEYEVIKNEQLNDLLFDGKDSGMVTFSDQAHGDFTLFVNGGVGSAHGHSDNLHVSIYHGNKPFLIDTGRYTYREDDSRRVYLKSAYAHNVCVIDDFPGNIPVGSWDYEQYVLPLKNYVKQKDGVTYIEGVITGVNSSATSTHIRKVISVSESIWMICDVIQMSGAHEVKTYYHYDPLCSIKEGQINAYHICHEDVTIEVQHHSVDSIRQKEDICSLNYNELLNHYVYETKKKFTDKLVKYDIIVNDKRWKTKSAEVFQEGNSEPLSSDIVSAIECVEKNGESYTLIVVHQEIFHGRKLLFCHGVPFYGKCVILHQKDKKYKRIVLKT